MAQDSEIRESRSSLTKASVLGCEPLQKRVKEAILQMAAAALREAGRENLLYLCSAGTYVAQ